MKSKQEFYEAIKLFARTFKLGADFSLSKTSVLRASENCEGHDPVLAAKLRAIVTAVDDAIAHVHERLK